MGKGIKVCSSILLDSLPKGLLKNHSLSVAGRSIKIVLMPFYHLRPLRRSLMWLYYATTLHSHFEGSSQMNSSVITVFIRSQTT